MKIKVTIDGKVYEVDVEASDPQQPRPAPGRLAAPVRSPSAPPAAAPPPSSQDAVADESKVCRSPVAGVVVKVTAQAGQSIQANDVLMMLEAMKMETSISSPVAGKVLRVNVAVGDPVQSGQVLVEFE